MSKNSTRTSTKQLSPAQKAWRTRKAMTPAQKAWATRRRNAKANSTR